MVSFAFVAESSSSQSQSQYALIKWKIFVDPDVWELNQSIAQEAFNVNLFSYPRTGVYVFDWNVYTDSARSTFLGVVDPDWNRVVYTALTDITAYAFGSFGSNAGQFRWPESIAAHAISDGWTSDGFYDVYIADTYNNRICRAVYTPPSLVAATPITGNGLYCPRDVSIDNGQSYRPNTDDKIWVLNGNNRLLNFAYDGNFIRSVSLPVGCVATAVAYSLYNEFVYVADSANDKIYRYGYLPPLGTFVKHSLEGVASNSVVDIQIDAFGYVWALDSTSLITKYDRDLTTLCYFYQDNQFETTSSLSIANGVVNSCDMYIAETWSAASGIQHFAIGADILDLEVTSNEQEDEQVISYTAVDASLIDAEIYEYNDFTAKVKTLAASQFRSAGHNVHVWDGTNDLYEQMPTGYYSYRVVATSRYSDSQTGVPVNQVVKTGNFQHVMNCCIGMRGNVDGSSSDAPNVADLNFLVAAEFQGGPPPPCFEEADVDASGGLNVSDITRLSAYLFASGPALAWCP